MSTWEPKTLNYSHEALIDLIMANPAATNEALGAKFGRSAAWVGMVKSSGLFREAYAKRVTGVVDPVLTATVEERLEMLTQRSLQVLNEKMARPSQDIPDSVALAAAALGAKGMALGGFSSRPAAPPPPPQAGRIERLADRLLNLGKVEAEEVAFVETKAA